MKKFYVNQLLVLVLIASLGFSCSEEDEVKVDLRDQAIGTYLGVYNVNDGQDEGLSEVIISKDGSDTKQIIIELDGMVFFGNKIGAAGNGFGFDIPVQNLVTDEGTAFTLEGNGGIELASSSYDGGYYSDENKLIFNVLLKSDSSDPVLMTIEAEK